MKGNEMELAGQNGVALADTERVLGTKAGGVAGGAATGGTRMGGQTVQRFYEPTMQQSNGTMSHEVTR